MGRPTGRVKAVRALARAREHPARDPLLNRKIVELTTRFTEIRTQHFRESVDAAIELGEILIEGAPRLEGHYLRWLDLLGVSPPAALNYVRLAKLSSAHPGIIQSWKELGATKLYRVSRMTPRGRKAVLARSAKPRLMGINDQEFEEETAPYVPGPERRVTADMRAHGLRMKVGAWAEEVGKARVAGVRKPELRAGLRRELLALCAALRAIADTLRT